jgi:hypothetical protein
VWITIPFARALGVSAEVALAGIGKSTVCHRTFLANHVRDLVSIDFFTAPTARLRVLFVLVVLTHAHLSRMFRDAFGVTPAG